MKQLLSLALLLASLLAVGQNNSARSSSIILDLNSKKKVNSSFPEIAWTYPENEITFTKESQVHLQARIESKTALKSVQLIIKDKSSGEVKASTNVPITEGSSLALKIDRNISLVTGINLIEITAENTDGLKTHEKREFHVGETALADAAKLGRKDYALIFATDQYDNWNPLVNPIFDARAIAADLEKYFGFKVDIVENPTQEQVFIKLREYAEKKYNPLDQLFIFFAGHGFYDDTFKEGFVVTKESLPSDPARTSYIRHSALRSSINNNPCDHIFLVMDVCFGGTFDENVASRGDNDGAYAEASQSEVIVRKLQYKTRKYLTSGGKEYVSDGVKGKHSPFAKQLIDALESTGGKDGILTLSELITYVEKLKTAPQFGRFGSDQQGSEFVFVVK